MEEKRFKNLGFEYNGLHYEFGFGLEEVKELATLSKSKKGNVTNIDLIKMALKKNSDAGFITDKTAQEINEGLVNGVEFDEGGLMTYEEFTYYLINLMGQAIDDAAHEVEPAIVTIEKDNSVTLVVGEETYKLLFTRDTIKQTLPEIIDFNSDNLFEIYLFGSTLVKSALEHYKKRFSVKLHDQLFLSIWATKFNPDTERDLHEVIHALAYHMNEVVESGVKKSKAAFKMKTH